MSESYSSRRERRLKARQSLPESLRDRIPPGNAEAAAALSPAAQHTLGLALDRGLKHTAQSIELLASDPAAGVDDLLAVQARKPPREWQAASENIPALAQLIQICYPDMPRLAAEALSLSPALQSVRNVFSAHEAFLRTNAAHPDFVIVVYAGLWLRMRSDLNTMLRHTPAYQGALERSGLPWRSHFSQE